ncbi:hypothetical protein [Agromyces laixinhei]|uniref:hypothetical protein n=1 Tax=Agromyces laixinhei TaxID=2585717 RepID=UPI0012EE6442|nr:hypothetical protein [Agromyces laixinhei]
MAQRRSIWRSRSRAEVAEPPGADDDPYALYLRWVEAGRPSLDGSERAADPPIGGDPDDFATDGETPEGLVDDAGADVRPASTPSTGHVNAVGESTGAVASIRRRFWPFGRG